jgi:HK97 gp10 family phage protein
VGSGVSIEIYSNIVGLKELEQSLHELGSEVAGKNGGLVRNALMAAAKPVLESAQTLVPKDTHRLEKQLRRTRQKEVDRELNANEAVDVGLISRRGRGTAYGSFVEFGTSQKAARPYLRPALKSNVEKSIGIFRKNLATGIVRVARKVGNENARKVGARIRKI